MYEKLKQSLFRKMVPVSVLLPHMFMYGGGRKEAEEEKGGRVEEERKTSRGGKGV